MEFRNEYRGHIAEFLKKPGGKYFMAALLAKEAELTVGAMKGSTQDEQIKLINQLAGVNFSRDLLQRLAEPPASKKQG